MPISGLTRHIDLAVAVAAALPCAAWCVATLTGDGGALLSSPSVRRGLAADALLYTAGAVVLVAPLIGVAVADARPAEAWPGSGALAPRAVARRIVTAVLSLVMVSGVLTACAWGATGETAAFVVTSHAAMAAIVLSLAALGALCRTCVRDELDAALFALLAAAVLGGGLLLAGPMTGDLPASARDAALLASPFVALVSAAHIDILRMGALYQISPLAHVTSNYPAWTTTVVTYLGTALLLAAGCHRQWPNHASLSRNRKDLS